MSLRGYWRTFRPPSPDRFGKIMGKSDFAPAMTITKLTTIARTGRLMKISVNAFIPWIGERTRLACWRWRPRHRALFSSHDRSRAFRRGRQNEHARARALPRNQRALSLFRYSTFALRASFTSLPESDSPAALARD